MSLFKRSTGSVSDWNSRTRSCTFALAVAAAAAAVSVSPPEVTAEQEKAALETGLRGYQEFEWMHLTAGGEAGLGLGTWLNLGFVGPEKRDEETALIEMAAASIFSAQ